MKITAFNGSPRAERGNTHVMVDAFLKGAEEASADIENVFLARKKIEPCIACYACWMKTPGTCAHEDNMRELLAKFVSSDVVVFASPVYVDNVTGIMKVFIDRLIPIGDPHIEKDANGECRHVKKHEKPKKIAVISNCGFPEQSHFQVLRLYFRRVARNLGAEVIAELYRGGGGLLTHPASRFQPFVESYKQLVKKAGAEVARHSKLSEDTIARLEMPLIPGPNFADEYLKSANRRVDEMLAQLDTGPAPE